MEQIDIDDCTDDDTGRELWASTKSDKRPITHGIMSWNDGTTSLVTMGYDLSERMLMSAICFMSFFCILQKTEGQFFQRIESTLFWIS